MDITKVFKRLIVLAFLLILLSIIAAAFYPTPKAVNEFNDLYYMQWSEDNYFLIFLVIPLIILHFISFYMLYKLKKIGKRIFEITIILFFLYDISSGNYAMSGLELVISELYYMIYGALLAMIYFTPLKKDFKNK